MAQLFKPQTRTIPLAYFFGASSAVQWYCPPAVGYLALSSARLSAVAPIRNKMTMQPYMIVTGPPWNMARNIDAATPAQLLQTLNPAESTSRAPIVRGGCGTSAKTSTSPSLELAVTKCQSSTIMLAITQRCICCANWPQQAFIKGDWEGTCHLRRLLSWLSSESIGVGSVIVFLLTEEMSLIG